MFRKQDSEDVLREAIDSRILSVSIRVHPWLKRAMPKLLCVYCSSSDRLDAKYVAAAEAFGRAMTARGWGLVYGGGKTGLMGAVARAVKRDGGRVVGVIPEFMKAKELAYEGADELVTVLTMRERKTIMETRADGFVALPGGWGTLEEIMEIITLRSLDVLRKPCVFFNQDGFYDDLAPLLRKDGAGTIHETEPPRTLRHGGDGGRSLRAAR
jgi:uncharacterized protein (TIGR00730 family)